MKKLNTYLLALMGVFALTWSACTDSYDYDPAEEIAGAQVYFSTAMPSQVNLAKNATSFDVTVSRINTTEALTVNLTATDKSGLFTIPTTANFAAGAETIKLSIGYDPDKLEYDDFKAITIAIADANLTTPYGTSTYSFKAGIPAPWTSLGNAIFSDAFLFEKTYQVELQQNDLNPTMYRLVDPYSQGLEAEGLSTHGDQSPYLTFQILKAGDMINKVKITTDGLVYFDAYCTGFYNTSNDYNKNVDAHHPSDFTKFQAESFWMYSTVKAYTKEGKPAIVQLAPYYYMDGLGGWDYSQEDGVIRIAFPGIVLTDYTAEVAYIGRYTDVSNKNYAIAKVTLGEDVESAKVALVSGEDIEATTKGIIDGSIKSEELTENSTITFPCDEGGVYSFVVVTYGGGEAQENASATFNFSTGGSPFDDLLQGTSIDDYVGNWLIPAATSSASGNLAASVKKIDNQTLVVKGLLGEDGYDDTFYLDYDKETGWIILAPQDVEPYDGYDAVLALINSSAGKLTTKEYFVGGLTKDGKLTFLNAESNTLEWDSFGYCAITDKGASLYSPYCKLIWSPVKKQSAEMNTKLLKGFSMQPLQMNKKTFSTAKNIKVAQTMDGVMVK